MPQQRDRITNAMFHQLCYIAIMPLAGLFTLKEAGEHLGVSSERVRRYVQRGLLPGGKLANTWLLPAKHVLAFKGCLPRGGRPLSQRAAWECLIAGDIDLDDPHRYMNRGLLSRWAATSGAIVDLLLRDDIVLSGMHAAVAYGALLDPLPTEAQVYIELPSPDTRASELLSTMGMVPNPIGNVIARSVAAEPWGLLKAASSAFGDRKYSFGVPPSARCAPRSAVAVDLVLSPHARERDVADHLIRPS